MKFTITEITEWDEDFHMEAGDACHMSDGDIMRLKLSEYERKIENHDWPGLPFTCEADSREDAIDKYNQKNCDRDYYLASDADFEDPHEWESFTLKQLMETSDDEILFRINDEMGDEKVVFNNDYKEDDEGVLEVLYPILDRKVRDMDVGMSEDPISPTNKMPTIWVTLEEKND